MKRLLYVFITIIILQNTNISLAQEKPALPYIAKGECPFEGCTYGKWQTRKNQRVYQNEGDTTKIAFVLKAKSKFRAVTGNVHVLKLGALVALKPKSISAVSYSGDDKEMKVKAGDKIYLLHPVGEGFYSCWFMGMLKDISCELWDCIVGKKTEGDFDLQLLNEPEYEWWVKIKDGKGITGWI